MRYKNVSMTNESLTKQTRLLGSIQVSNKIRFFLYLKRKLMTRILNRGEGIVLKFPTDG